MFALFVFVICFTQIKQTLMVLSSATRLSSCFQLGACNGIIGPMRAYVTEACRREHQPLGVSLIMSAWGIGLVIGPVIGGFLAQETLHSHSAEDKLRFNDVEKSQSTQSKTSNSSLTLLRNWPLMSMIIVFSIFQMHDTAYSEVFSLWAMSPRSLGGLSFSTDNVGQALAAAGIGMLSCNLLLYPVLGSSLGPLTVTRTGAMEIHRIYIILEALSFSSLC
ncbi:protein ZINC INDUCED FACILITATOR-LIKE 1-like isoform X2 [Silene latifolia]|uniref:protein ZINC INDUCED FACILITATOR-LIKE 1-like isoform X2 n=1 Tax=Silene latifolia TaxID=37657 RepID=UPI003D781D4E